MQLTFIIAFILYFVAQIKAFDLIELNLGEQKTIDFSYDKINYFVQYSDFDTNTQNAGLCVYSTRLTQNKIHYMFNNTMYNLNEYDTVQLPFLKNQRAYNLTLQMQNFEDENGDIDPTLQELEVFDSLKVQVCGIEQSSAAIPYVTNVDSTTQTNLYFFKNNGANPQHFTISQYQVAITNLKQAKTYMLNLNSIHLRSKKIKMFVKMIVKYNVISYEDGEQTNLWEYPTELTADEQSYLKNTDDQTGQFMYSDMFDCVSGNKCGVAVTIFYVFPSNLGKFASPFARIQATEFQTRPYYSKEWVDRNDGEYAKYFLDISDYCDGQNISGEFSNASQFAHFYFDLSDSENNIYKLSQKSTGSQPAFQICEQTEENGFSCQDQAFYAQDLLSFSQSQTKQFYLVFSPSLSTGLLASKKQKFDFQISQGVFLLDNDQVVQQNFGSQNTFAIKFYTDDRKLTISVVFLSISKDVPDLPEFANGSQVNMDQWVTFCTEQDVNKCDFEAYKEPSNNPEFQTFEKVAGILGAYKQTVTAPQNAVYAIVNQQLYVTASSGDSKKVINMQSQDQYDFVTQVSETIATTLEASTKDSKSGWWIVLWVALGLIGAAIIGIIIYVVVRRSKKPSQDDNGQMEYVEEDDNDIQDNLIPKQKTQGQTTVVTAKSDMQTQIA